MSDFVNITRNNNDIISNYSANPDSEGDVGDGSFAAQLAEIVSQQINIKYPPAPLVGAKGDGTDDTTAIQNILNNYKNIFVPSGTYSCHDLIPKEGTIIQGQNSLMAWGSYVYTPSRFVYNGAGSTYIIKNRVWGTDGTPGALTLKNMSFDGNSKSGNGVLAGDNTTITDCEFTNCNQGVVNARTCSVIDRSIFRGCNSGIYQLTDSRVTNNTFQNNAIGIDMTSSNDNIISHNKLEWNTDKGINLVNGVFNTISSNIFDRNTNYGIYTSGANQLNITGNQFERNMTNNLYLGGAYITVTGNTILQKNSQDDGSGTVVPAVHIHIQSVSNSVIRNNYFQGGKCFDSTYQYESQNVFKDNSLNGLDETSSLTIPSTSCPASTVTTIHIPFPSSFYDSSSAGWDYAIERVNVQTGGATFPGLALGGLVTAQMNQNDLSITYNNTTASAVTVTGSVLVRHITWNKR